MNTKVDKEIFVLRDGLKILGINHEANVLKVFARYIEILYAYRSKVHLISHADYNRIALRHFLPSLVVLRFIEESRDIADIGAGAGFPSIPLKILKPDINFTLFESIRKKALYLEYLVKELRLDNISIINNRAETCERKRAFDVVLARAAGRIVQLVNAIDALLHDSGKAIMIKSFRVERELQVAQRSLKKKNLDSNIIKLLTPIERMPISLVILDRKVSGQCSGG